MSTSLLDRPGSAAPTVLADLTARERDVLALMAEGLSDRGIASHLWLSRKTIETHIGSILRKLGEDRDPHANRRVRAVLAYLSALSVS